VQAAINAARGVLPTGMPNPPTYNKVNPADTPILTLELTSDSLPLEKVNDLADTTLAQKLSEVTGVGLVTIEGNQKPAVRVQVNPAAIASLGLSLEDVRTALIQSSVNAPKGSFDEKAPSSAAAAVNYFWKLVHSQVDLLKNFTDTVGELKWKDWKVPLFVYLSLCLGVRLSVATRPVKAIHSSP